MKAETQETLPAAGEERGASAGRSRLTRLLPWGCLGLLLALHFALLMTRFAPAIATPDANGYWAQGSLLFTTGRTWFEPQADAQYVGGHWLVTESGRYFSRYPPGLSVLVGLVYRLFGHEAGVLVNPGLAALSLVGLYLLLKRFLGPWWSLAGVFVLAANPVFNQHAIWCFAHMAVTFCLAWGLYFLARWSGRGRLWEVFLAGLFLGCIPAVRYPEAIFGLGAGVFLLMHLGSRKRLWLHCLVAAAGAALPLAPLLVRNHLAFGAFYRTAYALTNEQTGFGWGHFSSHFIAYVRGLHGEGVGPFFLPGVAGMTAMCCLRRWRRRGVLLALLAAPSALLYMAYYWGGGRGGAGMRFLLPTFICYIFAGVWLLARLTQRAPAALKYSALAVVLLLQFAWGSFHTRTEGEQLQHKKRVLVLVTDALEERARPGDVVVAGPQILQHLDFVRRWRLADLKNLRPVRPGGASRGMRLRGGDPDAPAPMQVEKRELRAEKYKDLPPREQERRMARGLHGWTGEHKVYYVGTESELAELRGLMFNRKAFRVVARIALPEAPPAPERGRGPGMPGRGRRLPAPGPGGPGDARRRPGGDGRGFPRRGRGGPRGRRNFLQGEKELVIAEWSYKPGGYPLRPGDPGGSLPPGARPPGGRPGPGTRPELPEKLAERVRKLRRLLRRMLDAGQRPDYFWPRRRGQELRRLLDAKRFKEANDLLDEALKDYKRGPPKERK